MRSRSAAVIPVLALTAVGAAQTAFTYQGRLKEGTQAVSGPYDLRFRLFDSASAGTQVGTLQCIDDVAVTDGLFTTTVDFGQQYISPSARFLEIEARADTGLGCGDPTGFTVLGPRQRLTATPLASHSKSSFALDALDGSPANAVFVDNAGQVGIGTVTPSAPLHISSDLEAVMVLQDPGSASTQAGYVSFMNNAGVETAWMGFGTAGSPQLSLANGRVNGDTSIYAGSNGMVRLLTSVAAVSVAAGGNVGIGTDIPTAKLEVRGDIRLGASGQFRAAASEENLRIVRGTVSAAGAILQGGGFTVTNPSAGYYTITFTTPFASPPTVTAISELTSFRSYIQTDGASAAAVNLTIFSSTGTNPADAFHFIAIGPRS